MDCYIGYLIDFGISLKVVAPHLRARLEMVVLEKKWFNKEKRVVFKNKTKNISNGGAFFVCNK